MAEKDERQPELTISPEKVAFIIIKAREFDAKVEPDDEDSGSNPADDSEADILEDLSDDATFEELNAAIDALNEDEVIDLIALAWIGRGDFEAEDWKSAVAAANERREGPTWKYLLGMALLPDYLQDALSAFGRSCEDYELGDEYK